MTPRHVAERAAPAVVLLALAVVLFAPATLGGKVLSSSDQALFYAPFPDRPAGERPQNPLQFDAAFVFEPDGLHVREALREGRLPVWTPYQFAGRPLLAAQQSAPLFPLTWLGVVFDYWDALAWIAVLKVVLAALGVFVLARFLGLARGPALLGAIAFGLGTYLVDWLGHPHATAYTLLGWLFWVSARLCRDGGAGNVAALGLLFGLAWLGGQPESALLVCLATAGWALHRLSAERLPRRDAARRAAVLAGAALLGVAVGAVMLVPLAEALGQSASTSRASAPLPVQVSATPVVPEYWGRPDRAEILGPSNFTERTLYVGVLPLLLAFAGLVARRPRGAHLFFAVLAAVAVTVAVDTGPVAAAVAEMPVLDRINLTRTLALASFALALLAAFGAQRLLAADAAERRRMALAGVALAGVPLLAGLATHPDWLSLLPGGLRRVFGGGEATYDTIPLASLLRWTLFAVAALALAAVLVGVRRRRPVVAALVLLVAVDLLWMGWGYNPAIERAEADPPPTAAIEALRAATGDGGRVVGVGDFVLEPNTASRWGLHDARGHEQPTVSRSNLLWLALGGGATVSTERVDPGEPGTPKLLDVFGVRAVLLDDDALDGERLAGAPPLQDDPVVHHGPDGVVLEHPTALPEAWVAYDWRPSSGVEEARLHMVLASRDELLRAPAIETAARPPAGDLPEADPARVVSRTDTAVTVEFDARARGHLVLLDTIYPGWKADLDGSDTEILAANSAFRAVAVEPGRHTIRFRYEPASVRWGAATSVAALLALAALALAGLRARRRVR